LSFIANEYVIKHAKLISLPETIRKAIRAVNHALIILKERSYCVKQLLRNVCHFAAPAKCLI